VVAEPLIIATITGPPGEPAGPLLIDGYALPVIVRCYTEGRSHRHHKRAADAGGGDNVGDVGWSVTNDGNWFFYSAESHTAVEDVTHSWSVAHDLAVHLLDHGSKSLSYYNSGLQDGDIIFANWNGSNFSGISHVGVITGI
jgi:VCBS repeat-containing protein